jgi:hypothetical protein
MALMNWDDLPRTDAIIAAEAHREFVALSMKDVAKKLVDSGASIDVKAAFHTRGRAGRIPAVASLIRQAIGCVAHEKASRTRCFSLTIPSADLTGFSFGTQAAKTGF